MEARNQDIPFFRPSIGHEEIQAVNEVMRSGWLTSGSKSKEFENKFSNYIGSGVHSIAVNSATAALHLALEAFSLEEGDEVIIPTLTFTATAEVVSYFGAIPVFVDINPKTFCIDYKKIEPEITEKTKVIIPVHFAGLICDMDEITKIAQKYNLKVLADSAHALPATYKGMGVGVCGADATAFSFYANKTITTGEGGMLVTNDEKIATRARKMRLHGIDRDVFDRFKDVKSSWYYDVISPGYKYNLTDIAASIGIVQLSKADKFQKERQEKIEIYNNAFKNLPLDLPCGAMKGDIHSWHLYIIKLNENSKINRNKLSEKLKENGIGHSVHYRPLHQMSAWKSYCKRKKFPNADLVFDNIISLPLFTTMKYSEQNRIIEVVKDLLS